MSAEEPIIVGEYELRNCVATGNVSQIWECVERGGAQQLAMKLLLPEAFDEAINKNALKHEFKCGQLFEHPNIIRFYKLEMNRDHAFFTMDYFRAPSLKSGIASNLTEVNSRFKKLGEAVILALTSIHDKGWLHRDIKPENILMNRGSEVRLIDFSLSSKQSGALGRMLSGKVSKIQGTRTYIAPETLQKQKPLPQTDMYSLGITLYEALAGHPPFRGTSPNDLLKKHMLELPIEPSFTNPNITPECDSFILRMLKKKPKDRHSDMKELYSEFRNIKFFKEDPNDLAEKQRQAEEQERLETVDQRLDSRLDAERKAKGIEAPVRKKKKKPKILLKDLKKQEKQKAAEPAPQMPQQPQMPYPQQPMPGYMPQQPMPYPQPGYYQQPAYPQQQMYPPQQPMPYPQQPMPQGYPPPMQQPPMPQQPMPPQQQPPMQQPPIQQPVQPQQPVAQPQPPQQPAAAPQEQAPRHRLPLERPQAPQVPTDVPDDLEEFTDLSEFNIE